MIRTQEPGTRRDRSSDFVIRIYGCNNREVSGIIEHSGSGDSVDFFGFMSMIDAIESKLNEIGFPQAAMALRSWDWPASVNQDEPAEQESSILDEPLYDKSIASFMLRIQFRQNACWQGNLAWMEAKRASPFRSVLELIRLIDDAAIYAAENDGAITATRPEYTWIKKESVS